MVTGDDPRTAAAIAAEAGLIFKNDQITTGTEVRAAEDAGTGQLDELTRRARIYARVAPSQKLSIVLSLARNGHFVAVTGDGVNDAPALKHAHVGVAMGKKAPMSLRKAPTSSSPTTILHPSSPASAKAAPPMAISARSF